ncbi:MAG TPA: DUF305 domain-containing protein [Propionibacteriaceae bacterium]
MDRTPATFALSGALLVLAFAAAGCGSSMEGHDMRSGATPAVSSSPAARPAASVTPAAGPHNDADIMFATMMIPHHTQAIEMSDLLVSKTGVDPKVADLATRIKAAQGPEVDQMNGWLAGWRADPSTGSMGGMDHGGGDGMMTQTDMDALKDADAEQATQLFLTGMVRHHEGAVQMAETELDEGSNSDAKKLAEAIITAQNTEIAEMNKLLAE